MCSWPIGRGARFPTWLGEFDSRRALFFKFGVGGRKWEFGMWKHFAFRIPHWKHCSWISLGRELGCRPSRCGFESRQGRLAFRPPTSDLRIKYCAVRQRLERPVSETGVCEFESHPYNLALSRFGASHVLVRGKQPGLAVHKGKTELE